jgi:hypothetical protein
MDTFRVDREDPRLWESMKDETRKGLASPLPVPIRRPHDNHDAQGTVPSTGR